MKGTIKWYSNEKGFGFIKPDEEEKDLYFKGSNFTDHNISIIEGLRVEFDKTKGPRGPEAIEIKSAE